MASSATKDARLASFRKLIRDARRPERAAANPLAAGVCDADFRSALQVSLYRLSPRRRAIVARYDLGGEPVVKLCETLGLSRRQFFRDHRSALERLAELMLPGANAEPRAGAARIEAGLREPAPSGTPANALARGLRNAGAYAEVIAALAPCCEPTQCPAMRLEATLEIADLRLESGDVTGAAAGLERARELARDLPLHLHPRLAAHVSLIEGHLHGSHIVRGEKYERARTLLLPLTRTNENAAAGTLLVQALHALSLSNDHRGRWPAAREAAREAVAVADRFAVGETPLGLTVRANHAMRDARQFGNVDAALEMLRSCLGKALRNGWIQVTGELTVHFVNLNLMRSQYAAALHWRDWISTIDPSRLAARTRNFLTVDTAHALTMLGRPGRARWVLQSGNDEGLAFHGACEYWRAEALQAEGDAAHALRLAVRALDGAAEAESEKGRARSKRVVARCRYALGQSRSARKTMEECLELSEEFVSPYDLLLSFAAAERIELRVGGDGKELARMLRGNSADVDFLPPSRSPLAFA